MCRMLIAIGKNIPLKPLLLNLKAMAQDKTIKHEHNNKEPFQHPDGWGISYLKHNRWITKKSTKPIFKDQNISKHFSIQTPIFLAHVRKTSGTSISYENTHPFHIKTKHHKPNDPILQNITFCHNGSINDNITFDTSLFTPQGQTDTEQLLYAILTEYHQTNNLIQSIQHQIKQLQNYSGTNIILATPQQTIIALAKNKYPKYFQMYLHQTKNYTIISSESLQHPKFKSNNLITQSLAQETLLIIDNNTREIEFVKL